MFEVAQPPKVTEKIVGTTLSELGETQPWKKAAELIGNIRDNQAPLTEEIKDEAGGKTWAITLYHINEFGSVGERAILIAQDITKRVELEASLRQSEMMSLLGSLVAGLLGSDPAKQVDRRALLEERLARDDEDHVGDADTEGDGQHRADVA